MQANTFKITAKVWLYSGKAAWHFITVPEKTASEINALFAHAKRGWGSLKVTAKIGDTEWETSIFPDKKSGTYLLPLKKEIRKKTKIKEGDSVDLQLTIII